MLLLPTTALHTKALHSARQFAAEHATVLWVECNNEVKGVAPPTEVVMTKFEEEFAGVRRLEEDMDYDTRQDLRLARQRMFAVRFRRKWGISMTRLRENAFVPLEERQRKVPFFHHGLSFWLRFRPFLGTAIEPRSRALLL